ncbi:fibronectin-like [Diadema antillarum]|uniref:fibronectin-like n=1 Tax=Diadema antillarum TaxID=105358 RepID=UPI003A841D44
MDLFNVSCDVVNYLCVELSAPSADFTLVGSSQDEIPVECVQTVLRCQGIGEPIDIEGMTDTTLTVSWPESIGDFDSYRLSVDPSNTDAHTQLKSDADRTHTFTNLIPGEDYTVRLQLLKSSDVKGETFYSNVVLYLACPDVEVTSVTSREIEIAWSRPRGAANVNEYSLAISPNSGGAVYPAIPEDGSTDYTATFDTLTPAETYEITVTASGDNGRRSDSCDPVMQATDPGGVVLTVDSIGTVTADLSWTVTFADVLSGFRLAANVRPPATGDDPAPVYISSSDRSHTLTGLLPGTEYQFVVEAFVNSSGTLNFGEGGTDIARTTPLPPNNIMIELQSTSIEVSYTAPEGFHTNFSFSVHDSSDVLLQGPEVTDNFMVTFDNLDPGTGYTLYSKTISGDEESAITATEFTTRPSMPGQISTQEVTSTYIVITWEHSALPRSHYEVSYSPNSTAYAPSSPQDVIVNMFTLTGLEPYLTVDFYVRAVVDSVTSEPSEWRQRTFSSRPDPPEELMLVMTSPSSVNVLFRIPNRPNGLITSYLISYVGTRNDETFSGTQVVPAGPNDVEFREPIANLNPGAVYDFEVLANNEAGSSEPTSERIVLTAGDPEPSGNDIDDNNRLAITSSTISVVIDENLFSDVNGDITGFQVFVVEDGVLDRTIDDPPLRYQIVVLLPQRLPTQPPTYLPRRRSRDGASGKSLAHRPVSPSVPSPLVQMRSPSVTVLWNR